MPPILFSDAHSVVLFGVDSNGLPEPIKTFNGFISANLVSFPYGNFPNNNYTVIGPVISTAAAVVTIPGLHGMHSGQFKFTLAAGTLLVEVLADSGAVIGPALVEHVDNAVPGTELSATALAAGTYRLKAPFTGAGLRFTKSDAVNSINLEGFLSGAS